MNSIKQDYITLVSKVVQAIEPIGLQWSQAIAELQNLLTKNGTKIELAFRNFQDNIAKLPEEIRAANNALAERGWYIDHEFPVSDVRRILESLKSGRGDEVDRYLSKYYEEALPSLQENLIATYSNRAAVFAQAFSALQSKQYYLAIPVLLVQADGMCFDIIHGKLFQNKNKRPEVADKLDALKLDDFSSLILSVLELPGGISAGKDRRTQFPNCINRHEILHGLDCGYGTSLNAWKALSLVSFVGLWVPILLGNNGEKSS